jgi:hypothetical protein
MGDSTRSNADSAQNEGGSYLDFVKETFSNAGKKASFPSVDQVLTMSS